jgi:hypothetical protein
LLLHAAKNPAIPQGQQQDHWLQADFALELGIKCSEAGTSAVAPTAAVAAIAPLIKFRLSEDSIVDSGQTLSVKELDEFGRD